MERYCRNCGAELDPGANFCADCGERVDDEGGRNGEVGETARADRYGSATNYGATPTTDDTTFAAITHVLALFTWVIGPLVVLVATEDEFVEENARNALNWQIAFTIYMLVSLVLVIVLVGIVFLMVVSALDLIFCVIAAVKASDGEAWTYPITPEIV